MMSVGPWVTTTPSTTNAMGAETSQRSRRAETRPQMITQAETTARAVSVEVVVHGPGAIVDGSMAPRSGPKVTNRVPDSHRPVLGLHGRR